MKTSMKTMVLGAIAAVVALGSIGAAEAHGHRHHDRHHHFGHHHHHKHFGFYSYGYDYKCGYWKYGRFWVCKSGY